MPSDHHLERLLSLQSEAQQAATTLSAEVAASPWADHCREPLAVLFDTLGHQSEVISLLLQETE